MHLISFIIITAALAWVCRRQLVNPRCHGFYRFFAFVGIVWLLTQGLPAWHQDLFSPRQAVSLLLLAGSLVFLVMGYRELRRAGGSRQSSTPRENFSFENTQELVTTGVYGYVRHPMYTSLLLLVWGTYLKQVTIAGMGVALLASAALYLAARFEERENRMFFGSQYTSYRKTSRMFVPFLL